MASFLGSGSFLLESIAGPLYDDFDEDEDLDMTESWVPRPEVTVFDSCGARAILHSSGALEPPSELETPLPGERITLEEAGYEITPSGCLVLNPKYQEGGKPVWIKDPVAASAFKGISLGPSDCPICWCEIEEDELRVLSCGHRYCASCLGSTFDQMADREESWTHLRSRLVKTSKGSLSLHTSKVVGLLCPHPACSNVVTLEDLNKFSSSGQLKILDALLLVKLYEWLANDEVARCPLGCGGWIQNCTCTNEACRERSKGSKVIRRRLIEAERGHGEMLRRWALNVKARMCPRCDKIIEKNGGCDHMNCSQCKLRFNWSQARLIFKPR
jgi:hypothetical protein